MSDQANNQSPQEQHEERSARAKEVRRKYLCRFDHVKKGHQAYDQENWPLAIKCYRDYLSILLDYKGVKIRSLSPKNFDKEKELAEMLLISHIFWNLTKLYDRCKDEDYEFEICLMHFINFTIGFKYHHANLEIFRRYLENKAVKHPVLFDKAYNKMLAESKKCFVATLCFGSDDPITNFYRDYKPLLMKHSLGIKFVDLYYHYSPRFIAFLHKRIWTKFFLVELCAKPLLMTGYAIHKLFKRLH